MLVIILMFESMNNMPLLQNWNILALFAWSSLLPFQTFANPSRLPHSTFPFLFNQITNCQQTIYIIQTLPSTFSCVCSAPKYSGHCLA